MTKYEQFAFYIFICLVLLLHVITNIGTDAFIEQNTKQLIRNQRELLLIRNQLEDQNKTLMKDSSSKLK